MTGPGVAAWRSEDGIRLPWTATVLEIHDAIRRVQARCKQTLADPDRMATDIVLQVRRVHEMAEAVHLTIPDLHPSGQFFPPSSWGKVTTIVSVSSSGYWIRRGTPSESNANGTIGLSLRAPGGHRA